MNKNKLSNFINDSVEMLSRLRSKVVHGVSLSCMLLLFSLNSTAQCDNFLQVLSFDFSCNDNGTSDIAADDFIEFPSLIIFYAPNNGEAYDLLVDGNLIASGTLLPGGSSFFQTFDEFIFPTPVIVPVLNSMSGTFELVLDSGCVYEFRIPSPSCSSDCEDDDFDGICDQDDICDNGPNDEDEDGDGVPDGCDICECGDDNANMDGDRFPDACDSFPEISFEESPDLEEFFPPECGNCFDTTGDGSFDTCDDCVVQVFDEDGDGVKNGCDVCPGFDDGIDLDGNGIPDGCDCTDSDDDGVCDDEDVCAGFDDAIDVDMDGIPDGCDTCIDNDDDGVCNDADQCEGSDDSMDEDGDGVPDACDACPALANLSPGDACPGDGDPCTAEAVVTDCACVYELIDTDMDGVCDANDVCAGFDDNADADGDGVPDGCDVCPDLVDLVNGDPCPGDGDPCTAEAIVTDCACVYELIDTDNDGICDANDVCPGFDDNADADADGIPDGCDTPDDEDCTVCDSSGASTKYEYIKKVRVGYYAAWSGDNGGYADFTDSPMDLHCGYDYGLVLKPGFKHCVFWEYWNVWIDWNQDCDFDDEGEHIGAACSWKNVYGKITVPDYAIDGETAMRVSMSYNGDPASCDEFENGEVEDYTLNVMSCNSHAPLAISDKVIAKYEVAEAEIAAAEIADSFETAEFIGGEVDRGAETVETISTNSINAAALELHIYPNPASGSVNVALQSELSVDDLVNVFNVTGKQVDQIRITESSNYLKIDLNDYQSGIYTLSVQSADFGTINKKFIVK